MRGILESNRRKLKIESDQPEQREEKRREGRTNAGTKAKAKVSLAFALRSFSTAELRRICSPLLYSALSSALLSSPSFSLFNCYRCAILSFYPLRQHYSKWFVPGI
jgi:hypothetical protein